MATINTEAIDKINEQLNGFTEYIDAYMVDLQKEIENAGESAQEVLNEKMNVLSTQLTQELNPVRQKIIDIFKSQYQSALEKIKPIEPLLNVSLSLDTVVSVVKSIINILTAPYQPIIEFTTEVIPKVLELSANLQKVANYKPSLNVPNVEVPPLQIDIEPISPSDITG